MKNVKIVKIKTIYNETFLAEMYYMGKDYIDTDKGRISKEEIKEFAIIGDEL